MTNGLLVGRPRAVLSIVLLVGLLAALAEPMTSRATWVGYLPTTATAFESTVLWLPSLLGGVASWLAGQHRAHGLEDWAAASPRDHRSRRLPTLLSVLVLAAVVHIVAFAVIAIESVRHGMLAGMDSPWMVVAAPTAIAVTFCWCTIGTWIGSRVCREIGIPIAVLLPYSVYVGFLLVVDAAPVSLAVADGRNFSFVRPAPEMWLARLAFWSLLAGALVVRVVRGPTRLFQITSWAASAAAAVALAQGASFAPEPSAFEAICEGSAPQVCIDSAFRTMLPRYRSTVDDLWKQLPAELRPDVISSGPIPSSVTPTAEGRVVVAPPVFGFEEPSRLIDRRMFAARFGDAVLFSGCRESVPDSTLAVVVWWRMTSGVPTDRGAYVGDWLSAVNPVAESVRAGAVALAALSDNDRDSWFAEHADDLAACSAADLPQR